MIEIVFVMVIGYLAGCFQTSYFIAKTVKKTDIRSLGNGNAGASNTTVVFGWKYGVLVALIDIIKPVLAILLVHYLWRNRIDSEMLILLKYICGFCVILGHNFPFFMGFKGGKGTASLIGMFMAIDIKIGFIGFLAILLVTIFSDYIVLGTIALIVSVFIMTIILDYNVFCIIITLLLAVMSIYKHIPNLIKIKNGTETRLRNTWEKGKDINM